MGQNSLHNSGRIAAPQQQISFQELMNSFNNPEPNNRFYMHSSTGSSGVYPQNNIAANRMAVRDFQRLAMQNNLNWRDIEESEINDVELVNQNLLNNSQ
jgi:hypothetical protein